MKRGASRGGRRPRSAAWMLAGAALSVGLCPPPVAAQGVGSLGGSDGDGRSRVRSALYGAGLGAALSVPPVVLTSGTAEDIGIATLLGVTVGSATGALLPIEPGERTSRWSGALLGLVTGAAAGGLTLVVAWNDPSIEFDAPEKLSVGATAGGAVGAIVGAVLGAGSGGEGAAATTVRLGLSPRLESPGRWSGFVSIPVG